MVRLVSIVVLFLLLLSTPLADDKNEIYGAIRWSPDSRYVAYTFECLDSFFIKACGENYGTGSQAVYVNDLSSTTKVTQAIWGNHQFEWSPSGNAFVIISALDVSEPASTLVTLDGLEVQTLRRPSPLIKPVIWSEDDMPDFDALSGISELSASSLVISPDASLVAYQAKETHFLTVSNLDGTNQRELMEVSGLWEMQWSPDGSLIAVVTDSFNPEQSTLHFFSMTDPDREFEVLEGYTLPQWSEDGSRFVSLSSQQQVEMHVNQQSDDGFVEAVFDLTSSGITEFDPVVSLSPDGQYLHLIVPTEYNVKSCVVSVSDGSLVVCTPRFSPFWSVDWSPDSTMLALSHPGLSYGGVAVISVTDQTIRELHGLPNELAIVPKWSPDGQRLAYLLTGAATPLVVRTLGDILELHPMSMRDEF